MTIEQIRNEYSTIKAKAMHGHKISRKEAMKALKLKKLINEHDKGKK